jgi:ParB-like chromosome segregation protein Spo0J
LSNIKDPIDLKIFNNSKIRDKTMDNNHKIVSPVLIDIKDLDENPGPFCMSYGFNLNKIIASIKAVGLINRPLVRRNRAGSLDIVAGYRRILALKALNLEKVSCVELDNLALTDRDLLLLNMYDNICTRSFNQVEKAMILNRLIKFFSMEDIYLSFMSMFDISSRREADLLVKLEKFDDESKEIIARERMPVKTIELLLEQDTHARNLILKWISKLKLNTNQQALFIEYINDISIKEDKSIHEILIEKNFTDLVESSQNIPQRAKRFMDRLKERRLPVLIRYEKEFSNQIFELGLPHNVRIKHSPNFESQDFLLEISFRDGKMLKKVINELERNNGLSNIKDPWNN